MLPELRCTAKSVAGSLAGSIIGSGRSGTRHFRGLTKRHKGFVFNICEKSVIDFPYVMALGHESFDPEPYFGHTLECCAVHPCSPSDAPKNADRGRGALACPHYLPVGLGRAFRRPPIFAVVDRYRRCDFEPRIVCPCNPPVGTLEGHCEGNDSGLSREIFFLAIDVHGIRERAQQRRKLGPRGDLELRVVQIRRSDRKSNLEARLACQVDIGHAFRVKSHDERREEMFSPRLRLCGYKAQPDWSVGPYFYTLDGWLADADDLQLAGAPTCSSLAALDFPSIKLGLFNREDSSPRGFWPIFPMPGSLQPRGTGWQVERKDVTRYRPDQNVSGSIKWYCPHFQIYIQRGAPKGRIEHFRQHKKSIAISTHNRGWVQQACLMIFYKGYVGDLEGGCAYVLNAEINLLPTGVVAKRVSPSVKSGLTITKSPHEAGDPYRQAIAQSPDGGVYAYVRHSQSDPSLKVAWRACGSTLMSV